MKEPDAPLLVVLETRRATIRLAQALAPLLLPSDLLVLDGALGAGKTFFARALCRALGVPTGERVASPTFALVHEHEGGALRIAHADLYRLSGAGDLEQLGLRELRSEGALLVVEWGAPHEATLGGDACRISLELGPPRLARITASGARSSDLVTRLVAAQRGAEPPARVLRSPARKGA